MIYFDYNATTPLCAPALAAMQPYLGEHFGNASSVHAAGREARAAVDNARDQLAALLQAKPHELIFTGSGTEANNLAVLGLARANAARGRHLVCPRTEHHAVLHAFEHLRARENFAVTFLDVDANGVIEPTAFVAALRPDTILASVMSANNETGVLQPMAEIARICRERGILLHSDMVQSFAKIETNLALVDAASFTAHKFYGPKGAGLLFLRAGLSIEPIAFGGAHENGRRPGTENVAAIAGMSAAAEWALADFAPEGERQQSLRDQLWQHVSHAMPSAECHGLAAPRLGNTLDVSFPGIDSETMLMALDLQGVCASSGSACMVGSVVASHVLLAMGVSRHAAASAIRFSLGKQTTAQEVADAGEVLARVCPRLARSYAAA